MPVSVRKVRSDAMPVDTNFSRHLLRGRKRAIAVERLTHVRLRSVISVRLHSSTILSFGLPSFTTHKDCDFSGLSMAECNGSSGLRLLIYPGTGILNISHRR